MRRAAQIARPFCFYAAYILETGRQTTGDERDDLECVCCAVCLVGEFMVVAGRDNGCVVDGAAELLLWGDWIRGVDAFASAIVDAVEEAGDALAAIGWDQC